MAEDWKAASIEAAREAVDGHHARLRLDADDDAGVRLYHVLRSLLEWSDSHGIDFDAELQSARDDAAHEAPTL